VTTKTSVGEKELMKLHLTVLESQFALCQLPADADVPAWALGELVSVTRTAQELSVVCDEEMVPEGITAERGWRCLAVKGPFSLELAGVLAQLTRPLAESGVPVFALSTFDTDYLLVKEERLADASAAFRRNGHVVESPKR